MIDILMATYNGSRFVGEQIESILKQTNKEWKLYIRDDGSKDNTLEILKKYQGDYPDKITIIEDGKRGLGAKLNFAELLKYSKNEYCMFCDQDDIWLDDKIQQTFSKMQAIENECGKNTPVLVHTNLKVVDGKLDIINDSFFSYQKLEPEHKTLNYLLVQNNITGCTMMMNRALLNLTSDIPEKCIMHDWWIAIVASAFGKIGYLAEPTMLYRQHGNNEVGAHKYNSVQYFRNKAKDIEKINKSINDTLIQGEAFYNMYKEKLSESDLLVVDKFANLRKRNLVSRKHCVLKNKFLKSGTIRNLAYITFI